MRRNEWRGSRDVSGEKVGEIREISRREVGEVGGEEVGEVKVNVGGEVVEELIY